MNMNDMTAFETPNGALPASRRDGHLQQVHNGPRQRVGSSWANHRCLDHSMQFWLDNMVTVLFMHDDCVVLTTQMNLLLGAHDLGWHSELMTSDGDGDLGPVKAMPAMGGQAPAMGRQAEQLAGAARG